ncbi:hypothetical protein WBZ18_17930 [Clostridium botulinum]|uniref:DUF8042 domain-containing protein n=2 Tax=Clostridium botulinum TaxID=1491 RepID=A0A846HZB9_CLOBO|nr:hypothetical protein [Clostridium botulinum]AJD27957.1 hypothetical protein T257_2716 [Clostridium botulinum CDC_297]EPS52542.1 hypothetical protein CFSAN002368_07805 [Clostridium botulinum A1 str. CFSAN002368]ACQ54122.1 conserved hypothetical protein [Clostridium botulinum Ba4 str. 657]AJE11250.1 hypothetical protein T259_1397 [Clostridium botulinum CDC_1436]APR00593.1 hypothetical protein RSJ2_2622 [Clostridium botulinum]
MNEKIEALRTASEYILNLKNGIKTASENFQNGNEQEGNDLVPLIADGINWITQVLELTKDVHKKEVNFDELNNKLEEIVEAIEFQDFILVGDLFQYEILPEVENMEEIINKSLLN